MIEYLGWMATAVFVASYFCRQADALRRTQMLGAAMWVAYGLLIKAAPVVVANLLVLLAATWTRSRAEIRPTAEGAGSQPAPARGLS